MTAPFSPRRLASGALVALALVALAAGTRAAAGFRISQHDRMFNRATLAIAPGDVVHFDNNDEFIHQIYIESPDFNFDSAESYPGDTIDVTFTKQGVFDVRCHIHPKMLLEVTVK
jgi:plastocyanin